MIQRTIFPLAVTLCFLISGCGSHLSITKRKYTRGYHLEVAHKPAQPGTKRFAVKSEEGNAAQPAEPVYALAGIAGNVKPDPMPERQARVMPSISNQARVKKIALPNALEVKGVKKAPANTSSAYTPLMGDAFGSVFMYVLGSVIATIVATLFYVLFLFLLSGGALYLPWLLPAIFAIIIIAAIVVLVLVIINSD